MKKGQYKVVKAGIGVKENWKQAIEGKTQGMENSIIIENGK